MSNPTQFGLFPSSVPRIAVPNPHRKKPSLSRGLTIAERLNKPAHTEAVLIRVNGGATPVSQAQEKDAHSRNSSAEVEHPTLPSSPIDGNTSQQLSRVPPTPPATQQNFSRPTLNVTPNLPPAPPPRSMSASVVEGHPSTADPSSPIIPMRSMFPTYNPSLPLARQSYYPQRTTSLPRTLFQREEYRQRAATPSHVDVAVGGLKTAPASVVDFPFRDMPRTPRFSSYRELPKLWEATNGQEASAAQDSFDLEMAR